MLRTAFSKTLQMVCIYGHFLTSFTDYGGLGGPSSCRGDTQNCDIFTSKFRLGFRPWLGREIAYKKREQTV